MAFHTRTHRLAGRLTNISFVTACYCTATIIAVMPEPLIRVPSPAVSCEGTRLDYREAMHAGVFLELHDVDPKEEMRARQAAMWHAAGLPGVDPTLCVAGLRVVGAREVDNGPGFRK